MKSRVFLLLLITAFTVRAEVSISIPSFSNTDSAAADVYETDSLSPLVHTEYQNDSLWFTGRSLPYYSDVQQTVSHSSNTATLLVLILLLLLITYLKSFFGNDLQELFESVMNKNIAQQIYRSQAGDLTLSSFLLHVNFILVSSMFAQHFLLRQYHPDIFQSIYTILFLIFLFTFFYVLKIVLLKLIGIIFDVKNETGEYIFHFTTICKTLGLTLFPALFVFAFTKDFFSNIVLYVCLTMISFFFLMLIFRGLSTAKKIVYRNFYHFIIYVCVVEASLMFLFFKLLTKTIK